MVSLWLDRRLELPRCPCHCSYLFFQVSFKVSSEIPWHTFWDWTRLSVLPGIAFSLDLIETTEQYGVAEVLLASFMAAFIFSIFGAQPLTIAGVTGVSWKTVLWNSTNILTLGPVTVFNKTIFNILNTQSNPPNYLQFIGWVYLWAAIFHWITAILNCNHIFLNPSTSLQAYLNLHRVRLSQIRDPLLLRYLWFLRLMGLRPIWHSSPYASVRTCWLSRRSRCLGIHPPCYSHARHLFSFSIFITNPLFS